MKVLVIGLGSIAAKHIAALRSLTGGSAEIYALRSRRDAPEADGVVSLHCPGEAAAIDFDFAIISNPTSLHADAMRMLADRPLPLMIEKPLFDRPVHDDLVDSLDGRLTYVACNLRFLDALQFLHRRIADGTLPSAVNEVNVYCGSSLPSWRPGTDWRRCYSARPELGGGVHLDLIHELDYICWLFGLPQSVTAVCRSASTLDIPAIDYANYCLVYSRFCASAVLNYYRPVYRRTMEIVMSSDIWTLDIAANRITDATGAVIFESTQGIVDTYTAQMDYFINLLRRGERRSMNGVRLANEILKITSAYEGSER